MNILDTIYSRRSVRKYKDQAVSRETLTDLLKAGMAAPSACNNQPWEFIAVDDEKIMEELRSNLKNGPYNAPAAIIPVYNEKIGNNTNCNQFWQQDLSAATENIMIAAAGMDLGTVWLGTYPKKDTVAKVQNILGVPEEILPLVVIYVGYPEGEIQPATKFDQDRVHWNQY